MKKNSRIFIFSTLIAVIVLYVVSAILTLGTIFMPTTAIATSTNPKREQTMFNSFVNVDVTRTKPKEDGEGTESVDISKIYVFVGDVRSCEVDENGAPYVQIHFQFKTKSTSDGSKIYREIVAKIPVKESSGGYEWVKVFDARAEGVSDIGYSRVKICTPDSIDLHEVVFTDETGYVLKTEATYGTAEQIADAKLVIDEQDTFTDSQSKKYHFTDAELKKIASAQALRSGNATIGDGPLSSILYYAGITVFHTNTFTLRIFDCLAGLGMLLIAYSFAVKTFGDESKGLIVFLSVLSLGAVFTASNFAIGNVGMFFAVLSVYLASRYFVKHYYLEDTSNGVLCLLLVGLFYGLAVAYDMAYSLTLIGHVVLLTMARRRAFKQFKREEKEAKGLEKEDVFLAYRKQNVISLIVGAISLLVLPLALFTLCYLVCADSYMAYYEANFVLSALKYFLTSITPSYQSFPLALFVGFGGVKIGEYYSFLNYFTAIFTLVCFAFVTFVVFFGKRFAFFKRVKTIKNKYKLTTTSFLTLALPVFLGVTSSPYGFAGVSVFMCAYVAFAYSILLRCFKKDVVTIAFSVATCIGLVFFGMAYVGYVGIALPEVANKILYLWQVL